MPIVVRTATAVDAASLAAVAAVTFPLACPPHTSEAAKRAFIAEMLSEERFREYASAAERIVFLAEEDGCTLGYTMVNFGEPQDADVVAAIRIRPTAELSKCYVLPGHHGAGVAAALMNASLDAARQHGAEGMWLGVNEENARAHRFYGKHGFEKVGTKHFKVGDRIENDFVLERVL
jgi:diamine N-acetyltransferase